MRHRFASPSRRGIGVIIAAVLAIASLTTGLTRAYNMPMHLFSDGEQEAKGIVSARPSGSNLGNWVIGGVAYVADGNTEIEGQLNIGDCTEVKYTVDNSIKTATKISDSNGCTGGGDNQGGGELHEAKGVIDSKPEGSDFGDWVVGGVTYTAAAGVTMVDLSEGRLDPGNCAKVNYTVNAVTAANNAVRIKGDDGCEDNGGGGNQNSGGQDNGGGGQDDHSYDGYNDRYSDEFKGVVESFPADLAGEWVISSTLTGSASYTTTASTRFQQKSGPFRIGACVEVKTNGIGSSYIKSIKTDDSCPGGGSASFARLTGVLSALPDDPNRIGTWSLSWTISSTTFISDVQVTTTTVQEAGHGPFYIGACVRAKYDRSTLEVHQVETESFEDCGARPSVIAGGVFTLTSGMTIEVQSGDPISVAYGFVTSRPTDTLFGSWTISDTIYDAVAGLTGFELEHGQLETGDCAKVRYLIGQPANEAVAARIESAEDYKCNSTHAELSKIHGIVSVIPDGNIGEWQIGDMFYVVTDTTVLLGTPVVSNIVEVIFTVQTDGTLLARRIKVDNIDEKDRVGGKTYGIVEVRPVSPTTAGAWTIAGAAYSGTISTTVRGAVDVGVCSEAYYALETDGSRTLNKIKAQPAGECAIDANTGLPVQTTYGFVDSLPVGSYIGTWLIAGASYEADASTAFDAGSSTFIAGSFVEARYIVTDGVRIALAITAHVPPNAGDVSEFGKIDIDASGNISITNNLSKTSPIDVIGATMVDESLGDIEDGMVVYVNTYTNTVTTTVAARGLATTASSARIVTKLIARPDLVTAPTLTPTPMPASTVTPTPMPASTVTPTPGGPTVTPGGPTVTPGGPTITPAPTMTANPWTQHIYVPITVR